MAALLVLVGTAARLSAPIGLPLQLPNAPALNGVVALVPGQASPRSGGPLSLYSGDPSGEDRCHTASLPSVNVATDFGARGDGVADDAPAFRAAIATGRVVHIPAGTYVLSQVDLSPNQVVVLCGAGQGVTTLLEATSPAGTQALLAQLDYAGGGHLAYLEIQDLTLDGNAANVLRWPPGSSMVNYGIVTAMVRKMLVAHTEIRNGYHGLRILDAADQVDGAPGEVVVRDNWFHAMALDAAYTGGTTHNVYVAKAWPSRSTVWIERNLIEACGSGSGSSCTLPSDTPGQSAGGVLFSPDGRAPGGPPQQVLSIKDNTFRNLGMNVLGTEEPEAAVYLYQQADNSQIIHNTFINSYYQAVAVFSSNNVEIAYNVVDGNGVPITPGTNYDHMEYYAIGAFSRRTNFTTYVSSSGWNIHDNTLTNSSWYKTGICACFSADKAGNGAATDVAITHNTFVDNIDGFGKQHTRPIDTLNAVNVTVSGNDVAGN